jgi:Amidohydrolase
MAELDRCVTTLGFVGCNLNPDPSGAYWTSRPMTDRFWYPLYEKMVDLDVPAMVHVSSSCNANFHATGAHYLNADTTAFRQLLQGDLFKDFPTLRLVIPHGGGAVPYHWGRFRGLAEHARAADAWRAPDAKRVVEIVTRFRIDSPHRTEPWSLLAEADRIRRAFPGIDSTIPRHAPAGSSTYPARTSQHDDQCGTESSERQDDGLLGGAMRNKGKGAGRAH